MIKLRVVNYEKFIAETKARIDAKVKEKTEQVANKVWEGVIGGEPGVDYPYWSGGYVKSWDFSEGPAWGDYYRSDRNDPNKFAPPSVHLQHLYKTYTLVTVSNANPYASHIEYIGSPSRHDPWKVAFSAYIHATKLV